MEASRGIAPKTARDAGIYLKYQAIVMAERVGFELLALL
jgi:hypothetical protein